MNTHIGIDSRMFVRRTFKRDGTKGEFKSVIGTAIRVKNFEVFEKAYADAMSYAFSKSGLAQDYKYYCVNDLASLFPSKKNEIIENFFEKIHPSIEAAHVIYTLFSRKQLENVKVYGRLAKRTKRKLSAPDRTHDELITGHINQCFPSICAWRLMSFFSREKVVFHLDSYEGHISEHHEELETYCKRYVYPHGDCSNPLISTADLLIQLLDHRLGKQTGKNGLLIFDNIRPALPEFGDKLRAYPILNQHYPKITPLDNIQVDTLSVIKRPVYWVFKNDPLLNRETLRSSEAYRNLIDLAAASGGVVKLFDKKEVEHILPGDFGVYLNSSGKETIEAYNKFGRKQMKSIKMDIMVPTVKESTSPQ